LTGGKGIHVVVPIRPEREWPEVRAFAKAFCNTLAEADPERVTVALRKDQRRGRIFLDFLRNQRTATAVLPYSARAKSGTPVAAPITWDELERVDCADAFSVGDAERLLSRGRQKPLLSWGLADQSLPHLS
jgi:bifunctional non-homologous end joining protein LigD